MLAPVDLCARSTQLWVGTRVSCALCEPGRLTRAAAGADDHARGPVAPRSRGPRSRSRPIRLVRRRLRLGKGHRHGQGCRQRRPYRDFPGPADSRARARRRTANSERILTAIVKEPLARIRPRCQRGPHGKPRTGQHQPDDPPARKAFVARRRCSVALLGSAWRGDATLSDTPTGTVDPAPLVTSRAFWCARVARLH